MHRPASVTAAVIPSGRSGQDVPNRRPSLVYGSSEPGQRPASEHFRSPTPRGRASSRGKGRPMPPAERPCRASSPTWTWAIVRGSRELSEGAKTVLSVIIELDRPNQGTVGGCWLAAPNLASQCGMNRKVVCDLRNRLVADSLLVRVGDPSFGTNSFWFVALPIEVEDVPPKGTSKRDYGAWRELQSKRLDEVIGRRRRDLEVSVFSRGSLADSFGSSPGIDGGTSPEMPERVVSNPPGFLQAPSRIPGPSNCVNAAISARTVRRDAPLSRLSESVTAVGHDKCDTALNELSGEDDREGESRSEPEANLPVVPEAGAGSSNMIPRFASAWREALRAGASERISRI